MENIFCFCKALFFKHNITIAGPNYAIGSKNLYLENNSKYAKDKIWN